MQHFPLPKNAQFRPTSNIFSAPFTGIYDFNITANTNQTLFSINPNTIYFLDNFSFAGNIAKEDFLDAIDLETPPRIIIRRLMDRQAIYNIELTQYYEDKIAGAVITSLQKDDEATLTLSAKLKQTAALVGKSPIKLNVSFNMFFVENNTYSRDFFSSLGKDFSARLNK